MARWEQEVKITDIEDGAEYFIACRVGANSDQYQYWSQGLNGKKIWSVKPGIAIRAIGNNKLREVLLSRPNCCALLIPADADKRWKARKRAY